MVAFITAQEQKKIVQAKRRRRIDLPASSIDGAENGVIPLTVSSKDMTFRIPCFSGQQVGAPLVAHVRTRYSSSDWAKVTTITTADEDTTLVIPANRAIDLRGQPLELSYDYLFIDPPFSPKTLYLAEGLIYWPELDEVEGTLISSELADKGVSLRIRASDALSPGALVALFCHGADCESSWVKYFRIEASDAGKDVIIPVEPRHLKANKYGHVAFVYTVNNGGQQWTSPVSEFQVEGDLRSPVPDHGSLGAFESGRLEIIDESGKTPITLRTHGMSIGDVLTFVFWGSAVGTVYVLQQTLGAHQIGKDLKIRAPYRPDQLGGAAKAFSIVERASGGAVGSPLMWLSVSTNR
ncbi:hypothetical protein K7459_17965 [Pseudomonas fluorescens]|nr:hypothetical protein [Pseudomonas fluorescens]MBY9025554.1 hypothetical protein [Pseudomonas fluorescens]MBY9033578.1 hypothetical protein [Pseudomonas fluorescens]MBY9037050.1 hypothetical protein [Pseudomonas fluorescens]MBY9043756.1 hypothetical protein [Pseudomonas fluorescens]MBY9048855.1 hypothetical protein [Pseudomonas fluorescens]